ncbi:MAG TPA: N-acetyltransferase [Ignavibacteriales bacterium]|nr:N-acetyltransferase [Ignavibacteriales bacterium]
MIKLEPFTKSDFTRLISWIDNLEELVQFAGPNFSFPLTTDQLEKYLANENTFAFKVIETKSNKTIGHCEIYKSESTAKLCRILIGEKVFRGKGLGVEVVNLLLEKSFIHFNYCLAELNVYDWNISAIKCYEKSGFKINKDRTKTILVDGKPWKSLNMIITRTEWLSKSENKMNKINENR